jgi:uncharacterized membrane protein (UPF0136 family)
VAEDRGRSGLAFGAFFVVAGVAFLLERLDVWNLELRMLAPAVLIGLGIAVLIGARGRS